MNMRISALKNLPVSVLIVALILAAAVIVGVFGLNLASLLGLKDKENELRLAMFNSLWQFLLITVLGGIVGLFFKAQEADATAKRNLEERKREQRVARRESLLRTRSDLVNAYNNAKAIRRLLRACARVILNGKETVRRDEYNLLMRQLNEVQLKFEYYSEVVSSDSNLFPKSKELKDQLDKIEKYLGKIVKEFENAHKNFAGEDQASSESFKDLKEFVEEKEKGSPFDKEFKDRFHKVLELLDSIIAEDK